MTNTWTSYFGIENIALNADQKATLVDALKALGSSQTLPNLSMQWRVRPDGNAVIFEAEFLKEHLTTEWFIAGLANIFVVNGSKLTASVVNVWFAKPTPAVELHHPFMGPVPEVTEPSGDIPDEVPGDPVTPPTPYIPPPDPTPTPVATFAYSGIPMLRMALFGGINATWRESWVECTAYLAKNRDEWELMAQ